MTAVFAAAIFLSSALLFWLEPLFGKMVLPYLGGAPPVWNACILFYQVALVVGYAWAHLSTRIGARRHLLAHLALSILALTVLPFSIPPRLIPPPPDQPLRWILTALTVSVGLPFVLIAANGPLLQRAFTRVRTARARDPYFLYAASNAGSAVSLLLYPLVFERFLSLHAQSEAWRYAYVALLLVMVGCAALIMGRWYRHPQADTGVDTQRASWQAAAAIMPPVPWLRRIRWVCLAAIPSSLMLGVTSYISSEIAPAPLIWILPLTLYLATLVAAFSMTQRLAALSRAVFTGELTRRALVRSAAALGVLAVLAAIVWRAWGTRPVIIAGHLLVFTIAALVCHTRLAEDRPETPQLTEYYLWMAIGGGIGGAVNTILGPLLFTSVLEYPLALAATVMVLPSRRSGRREAALVPADLLWPVGIGIAAALVPVVLAAGRLSLPFPPRLLLAIPALAALAFSGRPIRFGGVLVAVIAASASYPAEIGSIEYATRNFYSVHRILHDEARGFRWLTNGVTVHGGQRVRDSVAPVPLTYYTPSGPAGDAFSALPGPGRRVGVIGLGAGALMFYAGPGDRWTFFEIDPAVTRIARDSRYFTFLSRAKAPFDVVEGDARLSLARDTTRYDILVLDAFSSDAVPVHLLTREALRLYVSRLRPSGVILMHVSNRFYDLGPIVGVMARDAALVALQRHDRDADDMESTGKFGSQWVALSPDAARLAPLRAMRGWGPLPDAGIRVWTDDYSSVLSLLRLGPP